MKTISTAEVLFATPRRLPKVGEARGRVVVVDVAFASEASGGGFEKITRPFIDELGPRLAAWVDHHDHVLHAEYANDPRFVLSTKAEHGACPELIDEALVERIGPVDTIVCHTDFDGIASAAKWLRGGLEPYPGCDDDARAIDTRIGTPSARAQRFDGAIRARGRDHGLLTVILRHLTQGLTDETLWAPIDAAASEFDAQRAEARKIAAGYKRIDLAKGWRPTPAHKPVHDLAYLLVPEKHGRYDKTELLLLGQQRAPIAVLVDGDTATFAASFESGIDFLARFKLSGGMPTLVSMPAKRLAECLRALGVGEDDIALRVP